MAITILGIGLLVFFGHFLTGLFERTKIPDVLILMFAGIALGPIANVISPGDFGKVGPVFTTLALIIILFEGGIHLNVKSLAAAAKDTLALTLITFVLTVLLLSLAAEQLLGVDFPTAILIGTILGGTSSAVVVPLVRTLKMTDRPSTVLFLESALTDVLVVVLTLALVQGLAASGGDASSIEGGTIAQQIAGSFLISGVIGAAGAFLWSALLDKVRQFPNTVFTTFAYVFILYATAELQGFSGAIAALTFGIAIANFPNIPKRLVGKLFTFKLVGFAEHERAFFAEVVFLVKTFFFVFLGLSITLNDRRAVATGLALTVLVMAARIVVVRLIGNKGTSRREAMLMSALVPKGLASAVLAALPLQLGLANGDVIQTTVYSVILFSIIVCAAFVFVIERGSLDDLGGKFFRPFAEVTPGQAPVTAPGRSLIVAQQSLGLPAVTDDLLEPNPVIDLDEIDTSAPVEKRPPPADPQDSDGSATDA